MKRFILLLFLLSISIVIQLNAQRFKAYLALGTNITEDYLTQSGNSQVGTRMGLNIGPGVSTVMNSRWETSLELLYSQNGYYVNLIQVPTTALDKITLHYIEVPLNIGYRFNVKKKAMDNFYKRSISAGIAFAQLFDYKIRAIDGNNITNEVRFDQERAVLFNIAATSFFNQSFALNGKGTLSNFGEWTVAVRLLYYL